MCMIGYAAGGVTAVLLASAAAFAVLMIAGWIFDRITDSIARKWKKHKKQPKTRIGRILVEHQDAV